MDSPLQVNCGRFREVAFSGCSTVNQLDVLSFFLRKLLVFPVKRRKHEAANIVDVLPHFVTPETSLCPE